MLSSNSSKETSLVRTHGFRLLSVFVHCDTVSVLHVLTLSTSSELIAEFCSKQKNKHEEQSWQRQANRANKPQYFTELTNPRVTSEGSSHRLETAQFFGVMEYLN